MLILCPLQIILQEKAVCTLPIAEVLGVLTEHVLWEQWLISVYQQA